MASDPIDTVPVDLDSSRFIDEQPLIDHLHLTISSTTDQLESVPSKPARQHRHPLISKFVILLGPSGIGKSTIALKYFQEYKDFHQQICWINAQSEQSIIDSFLLLAHHHQICPFILQKRSWTSDLTDLDLTCLLNTVYRHITSHYPQSLFILDGAPPLKASNVFDSNCGFTIQKFLPPEKLENPPYFLLTSCCPLASWEEDFLPDRIIQISPDSLNDPEAVKYIIKSVGVKKNGADGKTRQKISTALAITKGSLVLMTRHLMALPGLVIVSLDVYHMGEFQKVAGNLGKILRRFPLALHLAKCKINEDWRTSGFSLGRYKLLHKLVQKYIANIDSAITMEGAGGLESEDLGVCDFSYSTNFEKPDPELEVSKLISAILRLTVDTIMDKEMEDKEDKTKLNILALNIFNIMAYLPKNCISLELCYLIHYNLDFDENYFNCICGREKEFGDGGSAQRSEVGFKKAYDILENYGITWSCQKASPMVGGSVAMCVSIHTRVQEWRREYLKNNKSECGGRIRCYFENNCKSLILNSRCVLNHLKYIL